MQMLIAAYLASVPSKPSPTASAAAASMPSVMVPSIASFRTSLAFCWLHLTGSTCNKTLLANHSLAQLFAAEVHGNNYLRVKLTNQLAQSTFVEVKA